MKEQWKSIEEVNGRYQISSLGNVRNARTFNLCKIGDNGKGYCNCKLWNGKKYLTRYVHRLVAIAFINNINNHTEVNHIDENKKNNMASNLEWCTRQYNNTYGELTENKKKKVAQYTKGGELIAIYKSIQEASNKTGASNSHIGSVCNGKRNYCGGYVWSYLNGTKKEMTARL